MFRNVLFSRRSRLRAREEVDATPPPVDHAAGELHPETFRATFDHAPYPVAMVAGRGESAGRLVRVNPAFAELLGTSVEDLRLREIAAVTHPDDRDRAAAVGATVPDDDGATTVVRTRYLHAAGHAVPVEVRVCAVRDSDGAVSCWINHVIDLAEREAAERALADAARIRREVVSTISHELRTPLTSVQGYLEMIAGEDFGALTAEQKRMIDVAMRNAHRLEALVADLVMLARLDAAELEPIRRVPVDLAGVVDAAVGEISRASAARRQDLRVELPPVPITVHGDAAHLKRAVQSLLANAIKYTVDGDRVEVSVRDADGWAEVAVVDTGAGIAAAEIGLLGERFYRGTDPQRRAIGGAGLGLAIAKTIIERHSGELHVASTPGEGSRFTLALPTVR